MLLRIKIWFTTKKLSVTTSFYSGQHVSGKIVLNFLLFPIGLGLGLEQSKITLELAVCSYLLSTESHLYFK